METGAQEAGKTGRRGNGTGIGVASASGNRDDQEASPKTGLLDGLVNRDAVVLLDPEAGNAGIPAGIRTENVECPLPQVPSDARSVRGFRVGFVPPVFRESPGVSVSRNRSLRTTSIPDCRGVPYRPPEPPDSPAFTGTGRAYPVAGDLRCQGDRGTGWRLNKGGVTSRKGPHRRFSGLFAQRA